MSEKIKFVLYFLGCLIYNTLGGWDIWLSSLFTMMALDIITGIIKSVLLHSNKSKSGGLNSTSMFIGGIKKILILILIAIGSILDKIIAPNEIYIRIMIISYYLANECLSILENIGAIGLPLPKFLYKILDSLKKDK